MRASDTYKGKYKGTNRPVDDCSVPTGAKRRQKKSITQYNTKWQLAAEMLTASILKHLTDTNSIRIFDAVKRYKMSD